MAKRQIRKSDVKELNEKISFLDYEISKKQKVEVLDEKIVLVDGVPCFFYYKRRISPTLHFLNKYPSSLSSVVVDMGAVKFVVNGADIMRPGILSCEEFIEDDLVVIVDEKNKKPLSVGIALFDSETVMDEDSGKVISNIHYVGDDTWNTK
ncbi:DUF1947 domain-containing protein [Candidatus Woesearchaeota archaeon]|nr:DUF1947 domain-containing protein [Candidatus Woesearchaeota archaeon]